MQELISAARVACATLCLAGCAETNDAPAVAGSTGMGASVGGGAESAAGGAPSSAGGIPGRSGAPTIETCEWPGLPEPETPQDFVTLQATLVEPDGAPSATNELQVCGFDICLPGESVGDGSLSIGSGTTHAIVGPAFKYGLGRAFAELAYSLPSEAAFNLGTVTLLPLPGLDTGAAITAGATAASGGVELEVDAGVAVEFDELTFEDGPSRWFRAAPLAGFESIAVPSELGFGLVVGMTPVATTFCPPASLRVPNLLGWEAGAPIELWMNGIEFEQRFAPYGGWAILGEGFVSADEATVEFSGLLPALATVGLRLKP
jgi:hypothetical protein